MAAFHLDDVVERRYVNELHSKWDFDKVRSLNGKPTAVTVGLPEDYIPDLVESEDEIQTALILSEMPNLYKQNGISMSKIPFSFETPVPKYFRENGFFEKENTYKYVTWAFSKCQSKSHKIFIEGREIILAPFEFISGRLTSPKECFLTENKFRTTQNQLIESGLLVKTTNSLTNHFTCYRWVTERFVNIDNQQNNQPITNRYKKNNQPKTNRSPSKKASKSHCEQENKEIDHQPLTQPKNENNQPITNRLEQKIDSIPICESQKEETNKKIEPTNHHKQEQRNCFCSVSVCICEKKLDGMEIFEEHKKIKKMHPDKTSFEVCKSDLFTLDVQKNTGWSRDEIDELWVIVKDYALPIRDFFKFCEGTVQNLRKTKAVKKINEEKSTWNHLKKRSNLSDTKASKKASEPSKAKTLEKDTRAPLLANWRSMTNTPK